MRITHYSFGRITVGGTDYSKDVIIYPHRVLSPWWRKEGHFLHIEDLSDIISEEVSTLIIGTGFYGAMEVPDETIDHLTSQQIEMFIEKTERAVEIYNTLSFADSVIAALHLTC